MIFKITIVQNVSVVSTPKYQLNLKPIMARFRVNADDAIQALSKVKQTSEFQHIKGAECSEIRTIEMPTYDLTESENEQTTN